MFVVISYDISQDKRRNKVAKTLQDYGARVQYSVFEVNLERKQIDQLRRELHKLIDADQDSIRFYTLCQACYKQIDVLGVGRAAKAPPAAIIV